MDLKYKKKRRDYWPPYPVNHPMVMDGDHQAANLALVRKIAAPPCYHLVSYFYIIHFRSMTLILQRNVSKKWEHSKKERKISKISKMIRGHVQSNSNIW